MGMVLHGRMMITTDETEVTMNNVLTILQKALPYHWKNRSEIDYLYWYYRGIQPILNRQKEVRPEICNHIVENRANEIVSFKSGYLMGEPLQYVSRGNGDNLAEAINQLNEFVFAEEKPAKDKELADWFHICGTSFRMVLPDEAGEEDDAPFEIYTLDPRNAFVVYHNGLGNKPILGVKYVVDENGLVHYSCYSDHEYFEIVDTQIVAHDTHILGDIPIIEYPLNIARIGAFELVIPLLDAINLTDSNRLDGVEQFVQALMLFHNVDISSEDYQKLREEGAIKFRDIDPQMKAEIDYLISNLNQSETQTLLSEIIEIAKGIGITVNVRKTRICKLSEMWRFLQVQYSLTETGRVIHKINPKRLTAMRRKLKKLAGRLPEKEFYNLYHSWMENHYRIMSRQQRANMNDLYNKLKEEHYHVQTDFG